MTPASAHDAPRKLVWHLMWLPLLLVLAPLLFLDAATYRRVIFSELGIVENLTVVLFVVPTAIIGFQVARLYASKGERLAALMFYLFAAGCIFIAGEEASWGQHWLGWSTPEPLQQVNLQKETNIHNTVYFPKRLIKWILTLGIFIIGVLLPWKLKDRLAGTRLAFLRHLSPEPWTIPMALFVVITFIMRKLVKSAGLLPNLEPSEYGIRVAEVHELYIAIYFMLYAWSMLRQARALRARA